MPASTDTDGEALVTALWPIDGPHRAQDFAQAMLALQHLLRYANHATSNAPDRVMPDPEDTAVIVRRLGDALGALPQLRQQLASHADGFAADPALRAASTAPHPADVHAALAAKALRELTAATAPLRTLAHQASSPLDTLYLDEDSAS
ncbi:hypothetical protein ACFZC5_34310 [Nocardia gamkensis]|uniref:hypothetical protein n=1 Tax=Nocardia gamkensis TaxID=352869 RepID=UPI0036E5EC49